MLHFFKKMFYKDEDDKANLPKDEEVTFVLKMDDKNLAILKCENGSWLFRYTDDFKNHQDQYNLIVGFSKVDKTYHSDVLWPFFRIRIPGLKQPAIQEILESEQIDQNNEVELLKRFGRKTIANPYELSVA